MRRLTVGVAALFVLAVSAGCSSGASESGTDGPHKSAKQATTSLGEAKQGDLSVSSAWAAATMSTGANSGSDRPPMSAGYAEIANAGGSDARLIGASSPLAGRVELHETVEVEGSAGTMQAVDHIAVPADGTATLQPGGYHLMIMDLRRGLRPGSQIEIDLRFAGGESVPVEFSVIDRTDRPDMS